MEARTKLVIGGLSVVAASVAVVTAVALTNTVALADSPGTTVAAEHVSVSPHRTPSATPSQTPSEAPAPEAPVPQAEVVEAPAPVVAAPQAESPRTPAAPSADSPAAQPAPADLDAVISEARAAGSWDAVRTWAADHGWPASRVEALLARLDKELAGPTTEKGNASTSGSEQKVGGTATTQLVEQGSTNDKDKNHGAGRPPAAPDRPAPAGSDVGHGNDAGHDAKKDQSRESPDRRD